MAKKLSELDAATSLADTDILYVVQGGVSKKVPKSLLGGSEVLFKWNETDTSQFQLVQATSGTDGSLSVVTANFDPYQPMVQHAHTGSSTGGWVLYRLLDDAGQPLVLPARYMMRCRMGPRPTADVGSVGGVNSIPALVPYLLDSSHYFYMHRNSTTEEQLDLYVVNGDDNFTGVTIASSRTNIITVGPNNDFGQVFLSEMMSRELSVSNDPAFEMHLTSYHDASGPRNIGIQDPAGTGVWTPIGGASDPDTAWDAGWNVASPQIGAGIAFFEFSAGAGSSQLGELLILKHPMDL